MIGVDVNDARYDDVLEDVVLLINKKSGVFDSNLNLTDATAGSSARIEFNVETVGNITTYSEGFNISNGVKKYGASKFIFQNGQTEFVSISSDEFKVNTDTLIQSNSEFKGNSLKINLGNPGVDKILTSTDSEGTTSWKSIKDIQAGVPIGTIVPILTSIFENNNNFGKGFDPNSGQSSPLKIFFGKGINDYDGWYLCHGETWLKDNNGQIEYYPVPDLSSFSYNIAANGSSQGAATKSDSLLAIPGGADLEMTAAYTNNAYTISTLQDNSNVSVYSASSGVEYKLHKMIYIVFLGESDLYWQEPGVMPGTELVFTNIPFYYSNQSGSTNIWTNGLQSQYSQNLTLVVPSSNPTFSAWQGIYTNYNNASPSAKLDIVKAAWRNKDLTFYDSSNSANSAKLYSGTYTSGSTNALAGAGIYNLDAYLRYSPSVGVILTSTNNNLESGNASTGVTVQAGFNSTFTQTSSSVSSNAYVNFYAGKSTPSWRASNIGNWQWEISTNGGTSWSDVAGATADNFGYTPSMGPGTYYYRAKYKINDLTGEGPYYISNTITLTIAASYVISGNTFVNNTNTNASGTIFVNASTVNITLAGFGGAGGSSCYTNATLTVLQNGGYYDAVNLYLGPYGNSTTTLALPAGTYTYNLTASFGCSSGNNASIS
jgi:hypothetical protein